MLAAEVPARWLRWTAAQARRLGPRRLLSSSQWGFAAPESVLAFDGGEALRAAAAALARRRGEGPGLVLGGVDGGGAADVAALGCDLGGGRALAESSSSSSSGGGGKKSRGRRAAWRAR